MKTIEFQDISGVELTVQHDSGWNYRIYLKGEGFEPDKDGRGRDIPRCIHLTKNQVNILINALEDLMEDEE